MPEVFPLSTIQVDDRDGNHYAIYKVKHVSGTETNVLVDNSAVSVAELPADITVSAGLAKETTVSAGTTITDDTATDGLKEVTIASGAASGTYYLVVRFVGAGAGVGSSKVAV